MKRPDKINLANLPTPIESLRPSALIPEGFDIYLKRDDFTGIEVSGNKIRKLEYVIADAIKKDQTVLITCGGIQSNHCRATAAAAARLGMKAHLVLSGHESDNVGNNALDQIFGAELTFVAPELFHTHKTVMENLQAAYAEKGQKARIIPMGASDAVGALGYFNAFEEILEQEKQMNMTFDTICVTVGSAGTYAGLYLGNQVHGAGKRIVGLNIYDKDIDHTAMIRTMAEGCAGILEYDGELDLEAIELWEEAYTGYGAISEASAEFIRDLGKDQGLLLDPVYTGKAFAGIMKRQADGHPALQGSVLFIHTGGIYGALARPEVYLK